LRAKQPDYAGRPIRIIPAAVAKEVHRSRNPLYTTHRALLAEIEAAASGPTPAADLAATVGRLECHRLTYKDAAGRLGSALLYRDRERTLEVVEAGRVWSFGSEGALFWLVSEAYRIRLAYLFDRY
jgi:hypothetical protein